MSILKKETIPGINISSENTMLTYTHPSSANSAIVLSRVELGDPNPIAGGDTYTLNVKINGNPIEPASSITVGASITHVLMQSREVSLEPGDTISLSVIGAPSDVMVSSIALVQDATPVRDTEFDTILDKIDDALATGDGTPVDHDFGGTDNLAYVTAEGNPVVDATIHVYRETDYNAGRRDAKYVLATAMTNINGRWRRQVVLDSGTYVLFFFKTGLYGPDTRTITVP